MGFGLGKNFCDAIVVASGRSIGSFVVNSKFDSSLVSMTLKTDIMALNKDVAALESEYKCKGSSMFNLIVNEGKR